MQKNTLLSFATGYLIMAVLVCLPFISVAYDEDYGPSKSPLRGTWSFSQVVPSTTLLTTPPGGPAGPSVPLVAVGTLTMDSINYFEGSGGFNTPIAGQQFIELGIEGNCTPRDGRYRNGLDCAFNFPDFGLLGINRYCVVMDKAPGRCFDEFKCVNVDEPGETVALVEFKRQQSGTCK